MSFITSTFNDKISLAKPNKSGATTITNTDVTPNARPMQIAILYKRTVMPDELVLYFLETELKKNGHVVFIDRHLSIGTKWAEEIERQLRLADVVIPLLSAASIVSEMLTFELETAQDSAQKIGKPRILPVRVNFQGEIGGSLGSIINPLQYALWNNSRDNETLISQINSSINAQTYLQGHRPEPPGGVVPIESRFYIERSVDIELSEAIANQDSIILLKGARQTGKTSLLARGLKKAKDQGLKIIVTDFQKLNANSLKTIEAFYQGLGEIIANQLGLHIYPIDMWNPASAPNVNFENYIKNEVLENTSQQVVWAMDEVDRLFTTDFGSEVFGLFRSWFNERAYLSTPLEKMSLVIVYALEAHLFITDPYQSPFNVGTKLAVYDFYKSQVEELNIYHGKCLSTPEEFEEFYKLVGGHPYLVRRGLYEIFTKRSSFDEFINKADRDEGAYGDHLRRILIMIAKNTELWISIMEISQNRRCSSSEDFYRLRTAGIVNGNSQEDVDFRCQIYKNYLKRHNPNT